MPNPPLPTLDAAQFALAVYQIYAITDDGQQTYVPAPGSLSVLQIPQGWTFIAQSSVADVTSSNYFGAAFEDDATGQIVIVDRGTVPSSTQDLQADLDLGAGLVPTPQFQAAQNFLDQICLQNPAVPLTNIVEIGHSLGGAEAAWIAGTNSGVQAMTFEAPGIANLQSTLGFVEKNNVNENQGIATLDPANAQNVTAYIVPGDLVPDAGTQFGTPQPLQNVAACDQQLIAQNTNSYSLLGAINAKLTLHSIANIVDALENEQNSQNFDDENDAVPLQQLFQFLQIPTNDFNVQDQGNGTTTATVQLPGEPQETITESTSSNGTATLVLSVATDGSAITETTTTSAGILTSNQLTATGDVSVNDNLGGVPIFLQVTSSGVDVPLSESQGGLSDGIDFNTDGTTTFTQSGKSVFSAPAGDTIEIAASGSATTETGSAGVSEVLSGGTAASGTVGFGEYQFILGGVAESFTVGSGGYQLVESSGATIGTIISGGAEYVKSGVASASIVSNGGYEVVESGGAASGATVSAGCVLAVASGGIVSGTVVDDGTIELAAPSALVGALVLGNGGAIDFGSAVVAAAAISGSELEVTIDGQAFQYAVSGLPQNAAPQVENAGHSVVLASADPLVISGASNAVGYTQGAAPVLVDPNIQLSDASGPTAVSATVAISGGFLPGDVLSADVAGTAISESYDYASGVLSLSGNASLTAYRQVLDSVTFSAIGPDPTIGGSDSSRTVVWMVNDGTNAASDVATTVTLSGLESPPVISGGGDSVDYTQGAGSSVELDPGLSLSSSNGSTFVGARVTIGTGFLPGDVLAANTSGTNVSASYDDATGVLVLSGTASISLYQQVLDSITYSAGSFDPTNNNADPQRTITWIVTDGVADSRPVETTVNTSVTTALQQVNSAAATAAQALTSAVSSGAAAGQVLADAANLYAGSVVDGGVAIAGDVIQQAYGFSLADASELATAVESGTSSQISAAANTLISGVVAGTLGPLNSALQEGYGSGLQAADLLSSVVTSGGSTSEVVGATLGLYDPVVAGIVGAAGDNAQQAYGAILGAANVLAQNIDGSAGQAVIEASVSGLYHAIESNVTGTTSGFSAAYNSSLAMADALSQVIGSGGTLTQITDAATNLYDSVVSGALDAVSGSGWQQTASGVLAATDALAGAIANGGTAAALLSDANSLIDGGISGALDTLGGETWAGAFTSTVQDASILSGIVASGLNAQSIEAAAGTLLSGGISNVLDAIGGPNLQQAYGAITQDVTALGADISAFQTGDPAPLLTDALGIAAGVASGDVQDSLQFASDIYAAGKDLPNFSSFVVDLINAGLLALDNPEISSLISSLADEVDLSLPTFNDYSDLLGGVSVLPTFEKGAIGFSITIPLGGTSTVSVDGNSLSETFSDDQITLPTFDPQTDFPDLDASPFDFSTLENADQTDFSAAGDEGEYFDPSSVQFNISSNGFGFSFPLIVFNQNGGQGGVVVSQPQSSLRIKGQGTTASAFLSGVLRGSAASTEKLTDAAATEIAQAQNAEAPWSFVAPVFGGSYLPIEIAVTVSVPHPIVHFGVFGAPQPLALPVTFFNPHQVGTYFSAINVLGEYDGTQPLLVNSSIFHWFDWDLSPQATPPGAQSQQPVGVLVAATYVDAAVQAADNAAGALKTAASDQVQTYSSAIAANVANAAIGSARDADASNAAKASEAQWEYALEQLAWVAATFQISYWELSQAQTLLNWITAYSPESRSGITEQFILPQDVAEAQAAFQYQNNTTQIFDDGEIAFSDMIEAVASSWNVSQVSFAQDGDNLKATGGDLIVAAPRFPLNSNPTAIMPVGFSGVANETLADGPTPSIYAILPQTNVTILNFHKGPNGSVLDFLGDAGASVTLTAVNGDVQIIATLGLTTSTATLVGVPLSALSLRDNICRDQRA